jgi:hypothetical protein
MDILVRLAICGGLAITAGALAAQDIPPDGYEGHPIDFYHNDESIGIDYIPTKVISVVDLTRLINNKGMSLQWMDGPARGQVQVLVDTATGQWTLAGTHGNASGAYVSVDGFISEVGDKYFQLTGDLTILNTPDQGRTCRAFGNWRFEITQNRKYYRLRDFEWCDGLTDYIDIYF